MIGMLDGSINTLAVNNASLVIGGDFTEPHAHIASTELNTGINDDLHIAGLAISPNPAVALISIEVPNGMTTNALVRVTDPSGRSIGVEPVRNGNSLKLNVGPLAAGSYQVQLLEGTSRASGRFVKE